MVGLFLCVVINRKATDEVDIIMLKNYIKKGAYNTFIYASASVITRFINFLFLPFFLSKLTLEEFGVWDFYQTLFSYGTLILTSCSTISMLRFYILYKGDEEKQKYCVGNALALVFLIFVFVAVIILGLWIYSPCLFRMYPYMMITISSAGLFSLFAILLSHAKMKEELFRYLIIFCGQNCIVSALTVIGVCYNFGINSFFYANCFSYLIFLPPFVSMFTRYFSFSWSLAKTQLRYSLPLLFYNFLYMGFFTIDRFLIKYNNGYEQLGLYALLWRFGAIFQFASMALMDTWPIVLYNAQKEDDSKFVIAKLMTYFCALLLTGGICSIITTYFVIHYYFPLTYNSLIEYLPSFFLSLVLLEIARLMHAGLGLATQTLYAPCIVGFILIIQGSVLYWFSSFELYKIFYLNSIVFIAYGLLNYKVSKLVYPNFIIEIKKTLTMICVFFMACVLLEYIFIKKLASFYFMVIFLGWLLTMWYIIFNNNERKNIKNICVIYISAFKKIVRRMIRYA